MTSNRNRQAAAPADGRDFTVREDAYFRAADWSELVALYRQRLDDPSFRNRLARASLHYRLGQILEERCLEVDQAIVEYTLAIQTQPGFRPALRQLRQVHLNREAWDLALQIAELESQALVEPDERATLFAEMGHVWLRCIEDIGEAVRYFERALAIDPEQQSALCGLARCLESQDRPDAAAGTWERLIACTRGRDRAAPRVALAALLQGPLDQSERAVELFRLALSDDPQNEDAAEALSVSASANEQWELLSDLFERRFRIASETHRRTAIAIEAGHMHLEQLANAEAARLWFERARELSADDPAVLGSLVEVERGAGSEESLLAALERAIEASGRGTPLRLLLEAASLLTERAEHDRALHCLELAQHAHPEDPLVLEALAETYGNLHRHEDLVSVLERSASLPEDDPTSAAAALMELGHVHANELGDEEAAQDAYQRAFAACPEAPGVAITLENLYRKNENWAALRNLLEQAQRRGPAIERCHFHCSLGELLEKHFEDFEASASCFEASLGFGPDARALRGLTRLAERAGNSDALIRALEREAGLDPSPSRRGEIDLELCELYRRGDDLESARTWAKRASETAATDRDVLERLARLQEDLGCEDELCQTLARLEPLSPPPEQSALLRRLAGLHEKRRDGAAAANCWQQALELEPDNAESLTALRRHHREQGNTEALAAVLRRLSELSSGHERAGMLEELCSLLDEQLGDLDAAIDVMAQRMDTPECPPEAALRFKCLLERAGRFEQLEQVLADMAEHAEPVEMRERLRFERAVLLEESLGELDQAREAYASLCRSDATAALARQAGQRLESLLERCEDWSALRAHLEAGLEDSPPDARLPLHERIASLCADALSDPQGCGEHLEAVVRLAPGRTDVWRELTKLYETLDRPEELLRITLRELEAGPEPARQRVLHARAAELWLREPADDDRACWHFERMVELEPGCAQATEFLVIRYEAQSRYTDMLALLEQRLEAVSNAPRPTGTAKPQDLQSLRLRIAKLRAEHCDNLSGAIEILETALRETGPTGSAREPLAALYREAGRHDELIELCEQVAPACGNAAERASWLLRLADCLREQGGDAGAAAAYRELLDEQPDAVEAFCALRDLYRQGHKAGALADLLEDSLSRSAGVESIETRMELAQLLDHELCRPLEALAQLQYVLELEADHPAAFPQALDLTERLQRQPEQLQLLDARLALSCPSDDRIGLLERRAMLLAGPLQAPESAIPSLREVLELAPNRSRARVALRESLAQLGRWSAVLECLEQEAQASNTTERVEIYERAVELAQLHLGADAALPWLERLRFLCPGEPSVVARIADVHRRAGRSASLLRALEDEGLLTTDRASRCALYVERAQILDREMHAPGGASRALEAARKLAPKDDEILQELDDLYQRSGRERERAGIIEARIENGSGPRLPLHQAAASLYAEALEDPAAAVPHLLETVRLRREASADADAERLRSPEAPAELLAKLAATLRAAGRDEGWGRTAEAELELLLAELEQLECQPDGGLSLARRVELHGELAWVYAENLANPTAALRHFQTALDFAEAEPERANLDDGERGRLECALLDLLRREGNGAELARRLAIRLERGAGDANAWLELARLRDEHLHEPRAALDAYANALQEPLPSRSAIREFRSLAERLAAWPEVAHALELELSRPDPRSLLQQSVLGRRLAEVRWRELDDLEGATFAYQAALEANPANLECIRSLQELSLLGERWQEALTLYERELDALGDRDAERRKAVWLAVAEVEKTRRFDPNRALRAYEEASLISRLDPRQLGAQAELYSQSGATEKFAVSYAAWCDDPASGARPADHLKLASTLVELGRPDDALTRARQAVAIDDSDADSWEAVARLQQEGGDAAKAAEAWERAAELHAAPQASLHLVTSARLVESYDLELSNRRLQRAAALDPGSANVCAHRARVAYALHRLDEAETAAARALDLAAANSDPPLDPTLQLETSLVGARAARERERLDSALLFLRAALACDDRQPEALVATGELLFERGDLAAARTALEMRLAVGPDAGRADDLTRLASVLELQGDEVAALEHFQEAVAADAACRPGHAGIARLCEKAGRSAEAVTALERCADVALHEGERDACAARLLRAAEIESTRDRRCEAERLVRRSLDATAENPGAWVLLAETLQDGDRSDEILELAPKALALQSVSSDAEAASRLSLIHARTLEKQDDVSRALDAYSLAQCHDSRCTEAVLAQSRLLRSRGDWTDAASVLQAFGDEHPDPDHRDVADVLYRLARLLSGPLEDIDGAIRCFERVLEIAPDHATAREPLASLLSLMPERWKEAIGQHEMLLRQAPTRSASWRSLRQIALDSNRHDLSESGLVVLRAIGAASPDERSGAPDFLPHPVVTIPRLEDPIAEAVRQSIQYAAEALSKLLETPVEVEPPGLASPSFAAGMQATEHRIAAAGLDHYSDAELTDLVCALATLSRGDDSEAPATDTRLEPSWVECLDRELSRRARRKIRQALAGISLARIRAIDMGAWRVAVRGLAAALAVDAGQGDLRRALVALTQADDEPANTVETEDWTTRIRAQPLANELLRRVATRWCSTLAEI